MLLGPDRVAVGSPIFSIAPYVLMVAPNLASSAAGRLFCTSAVDICRKSSYFPASTESSAFLASAVGSWDGWAANRTESKGKMRSARINMTLLSYCAAQLKNARVWVGTCVPAATPARDSDSRSPRRLPPCSYNQRSHNRHLRY